MKVLSFRHAYILMPCLIIFWLLHRLVLALLSGAAGWVVSVVMLVRVGLILAPVIRKVNAATRLQLSVFVITPFNTLDIGSFFALTCPELRVRCVAVRCVFARFWVSWQRTIGGISGVPGRRLCLG